MGTDRCGPPAARLGPAPAPATAVPASGGSHQDACCGDGAEAEEHQAHAPSASITEETGNCCASGACEDGKEESLDEDEACGGGGECGSEPVQQKPEAAAEKPDESCASGECEERPQTAADENAASCCGGDAGPKTQAPADPIVKKAGGCGTAGKCGDEPKPVVASAGSFGKQSSSCICRCRSPSQGCWRCCRRYFKPQECDWQGHRSESRWPSFARRKLTLARTAGPRRSYTHLVSGIHGALLYC